MSADLTKRCGARSHRAPEGYVDVCDRPIGHVGWHCGDNSAFAEPAGETPDEDNP